MQTTTTTRRIPTLFSSLRSSTLGAWTGALLTTGAILLAPLPAQAKADNGVDNCSWNGPAANPYTGDIGAAIDRYTDIQPQVRERLKQRMRERNFDEAVVISRDAIKGKSNYDARMSDMQFGSGQVCHQVSRASWSAETREGGQVYCEQGQCILVANTSHQVSRISRNEGATAGGGAGGQYAGNGNQAESPSANQSTPFEELRPGSGHSIDGTRASIPPGGGTAPGWVSPNAGPLITAADNSPVFSSNPGLSSRSAPDTATNPPATLSPVPEPESWGMMLSGLALLAFIARRKRQA